MTTLADLIYLKRGTLTNAQLEALSGGVVKSLVWMRYTWKGRRTVTHMAQDDTITAIAVVLGVTEQEVRDAFTATIAGEPDTVEQGRMQADLDAAAGRVVEADPDGLDRLLAQDD